MKKPVYFYSEDFTIDQKILDDQYVKLAKKPVEESLSLDIEKFDFQIYSFNYIIIEVTAYNPDFSDVLPGEFVVTWKLSYVSIGLNLSIVDLNKIISIRYVVDTEEPSSSSSSSSYGDSIDYVCFEE